MNGPDALGSFSPPPTFAARQEIGATHRFSLNHSQTLASAAYVASLLATYTQHPQVDYVHLFTGVQFTTQGLIGVTDGTFSTPPETLSSVGLVLHLWNQWARGNVLADVAIESGSFASDSFGWMAARDDNPLLHVLARVDGDELGLMLVNHSLDKSARVVLNIANHTPSHLSAQGLLGRAPDSNPGLTIPGIVSPIDGAVLEHWNLGGPGEVWIRTEEKALPHGWPSIRVPRSSIVFLTAQANERG